MEKSQKSLSSLRLSRLRAVHLAQVAEIERLSYADAWSEEDIAAFFDWGNCFGYVLTCREGQESEVEVPETVAAFLLFEVTQGRIHIADVAVHPRFRRMGLANRLIERLFVLAGRLGKKRVSLEVRMSNSAAIECYLRLGFRRQRIKKNYYPDGEDGVYMSRYLPERLETAETA